MNYDWDFSVLKPYIFDLIRGVIVTIYLGLFSTAIGTICGFPIGWLLKHRKGIDTFLVANDALKSLPTLFLMLAFNYFPWKPLLGISPLSPFACALLALSLSQAVFTADLVRGAIANVQPGPILAGRALGIPEPAIWLHIGMPDVLRQIIPALSAFCVGNFKLASIASVIGVEEVMFVARVATGQQFRSLEALVVVAGIYLVLITPLTVAVRVLENHPWLKRR
jgi:polar amino acid transport system permease protein